MECTITDVEVGNVTFKPAKFANKKPIPTPGTNALTQCAVAAFGSGLANALNADERDALILKLFGPLWGMAWRLAAPDHDLAEELRADVLFKCLKGKYNPVKGEFGAWTRTVMSRRLITLRNARDRAAGGEDAYPEAVDQRGTPNVAIAGEDDDRTTPFTAKDLTRINQWKSPVKQVLLLTQSLLWRKLPAETWSKMLAALGLADPFPCLEFEDMTTAERNAYLAEALGVERNTIHVRMIRWSRQLHELAFVRDLAAHKRVGTDRM